MKTYRMHCNGRGFPTLKFTGCTAAAGVERQVIALSTVVGHERMGIAAKLCQRIDNITPPLVARMKDVDAILVHVDSPGTLTNSYPY